VKNIS